MTKGQNYIEDIEIINVKSSKTISNKIKMDTIFIE